MPVDFDLPEDLADSVDIVYVEDEELDNLEDGDTEEVPEPGEDIDPIVDKSIVTFKEHNGSVFRLNVNHANTLVISGGEDDLAFVWNLSTGETIFECTGHKDSVAECSFSHDDKFVATGDMSGLIQVWNVENKNLVWCYEGEELEWLTWHHSAYVLLGGVTTGEIFMWQIPQGSCKVFPSNGSKVCDGVLLPNGFHFLAGYVDSNIRMWDLKTVSVVQQFTADTLNTVITSFVLSPDGKLLALCGVPSGFVILKTADLKVAAILKGSDEIECVAFCPEADLPIVASGSLNGEICFWDIARQAIRHKTNITYSVTKMQFGANALLYVSSVDGVIYVYSGRNGNLITSITGHQAGIMDMKLIKNSNLLVTSSDDGTCKVFDVMNSIENDPSIDR